MLNIPIEKALIAELLSRPNEIIEIADYPLEIFTDHKYRLIFEAMLALRLLGKIATPAMLIEYLKDSAIQDIKESDIIQLLTQYKGASIVAYAQALREKMILRRAIESVDEIKCILRDPSLALEDKEAEANKMLASAFGLLPIKEAKFRHVSELYADFLDYAHTLESNPKYCSGIEALDTACNGGSLFTPGELIILAGATGMCKTWIAISFVMSVLREGGTVAFFSAEMSANALLFRLLANESGIDSDRLEKWQMLNEQEVREVIEAMERLGRMSLYVNDAQPEQLSIPFMERSIEQVVRSAGGVDLIVLDHLGQLLLVMDKHQQVQIELGRYVLQFSSWAKKYNATFLAIDQIGRAPDGRNDKRPLLGDLEWSNKKAQLANKVLLLYRDSYYNYRGNDPKKDELEIILAKQRGKSDKRSFLFEYDLTTGRFGQRFSRERPPQYSYSTDYDL